jgi:F0F1-type ATP synthase alpha subunit
LLPAIEGVFDAVPVDKIHDVTHALIAELWADHKEKMRELNKGDKPSDDLHKLIIDTATKISKGYEAK